MSWNDYGVDGVTDVAGVVSVVVQRITKGWPRQGRFANVVPRLNRSKGSDITSAEAPVGLVQRGG